MGSCWGALVLPGNMARPRSVMENPYSTIAIRPAAHPGGHANFSVRPAGQAATRCPPAWSSLARRPDEAISPQAAPVQPSPHRIARRRVIRDRVVLHAAADALRDPPATSRQLARSHPVQAWPAVAACPPRQRPVAVCPATPGGPPTSDHLLPSIAAWYEFTPRQLDVLHSSNRPVPSNRSRVRLRIPPTPSRTPQILYRRRNQQPARTPCRTPMSTCLQETPGRKTLAR